MNRRNTTALLFVGILATSLACSDKGDVAGSHEASVAPSSADEKTPAAKPAKVIEEPVVTEDGELIFSEDFESGELPGGVIQGTEETP